MSYGGWWPFFLENAIQIGAVTGALTTGAVPIKMEGGNVYQIIMMCAVNGAIIGVVSDALANGYTHINFKRMRDQALLGAGTASSFATVVYVVGKSRLSKEIVTSTVD
jgi:hypothetical protein